MPTADTEDRLEHARQSAHGSLSHIQDLVEDLNSEDDEVREEAIERIYEHPLDVSVRSGWHAPGNAPAPAEEYRILLTTGGPAVRVVGDLNEYGEPDSARLQCQDWFTQWTNVKISEEEREALLRYAQTFYFGE